jgi:competence protein ComEC
VSTAGYHEFDPKETEMKRFALLLLPFFLSLSVAPALDIYWIDAEGGASTLIVSDAGETVLMDAGYPGFDGRDAKRIHHVLTQEAGAKKLDYFITSHFHGDHVGGLAELATLVPIDKFLDHGDSVEKDGRGKELWETYLKTAADKRTIVKPGDEIPLSNAKLMIVAAHSQVLKTALPGGKENPLCATLESKPADNGENGKSTGYLLQSGQFEFLNLGDLSWNFQGNLACPVNLVGEVDIFQATHHGVRDDVLPQQMWATKPTVAVMNNGPTKGAGPESIETVKKSPGLQDFWQLHRAVNNDAAHNASEDLTANLTPIEGCEGHWLRASIAPDGSYTLTNSRNGVSRSYKSK